MEDAKKYLSVGALLNYLGPDRPEVQFGIKEVMRKASKPTKADMVKLKRLVNGLNLWLLTTLFL